MPKEKISTASFFLWYFTMSNRTGGIRLFNVADSLARLVNILALGSMKKNGTQNAPQAELLGFCRCHVDLYIPQIRMFVVIYGAFMVWNWVLSQKPVNYNCSCFVYRVNFYFATLIMPPILMEGQHALKCSLVPSKAIFTLICVNETIFMFKYVQTDVFQVEEGRGGSHEGTFEALSCLLSYLTQLLKTYQTSATEEGKFINKLQGK